MAKIEISFVETDKAALPRGHYSQAVIHNGTVYVAGQLGLMSGSEVAESGTVEQQAEQALLNVQEILRAAGSDLDRLLKVTIYISDISLWDRVNKVYTRMLGTHRPARMVVPCGTLHLGYQVAIDAIAAV